jgi:antirestriction protein
MWFEVIVKDAEKEIKLSLPCDEQELKDSYTIVSCENSWDYENADLTLKELNNLAQDLQDIEDNGDEDWLEAYIEATGCDLNIAVDKYDTSTFYHDMSLVDVAYDIVEECYNLPENLERYFDYEAFARDLEIEGYTETYYGTILV